MLYRNPLDEDSLLIFGLLGYTREDHSIFTNDIKRLAHSEGLNLLKYLQSYRVWILTEHDLLVTLFLFALLRDALYSNFLLHSISSDLVLSRQLIVKVLLAFDHILIMMLASRDLIHLFKVKDLIINLPVQNIKVPCFVRHLFPKNHNV